MKNLYLNTPVDFISFWNSKKRKHSLCQIERRKNITALILFGIPLFFKQYNPNFKNKYFFRSLPLVSIKRKALSQNNVKVESGRERNIYIDLGSLPFHDNKSGIPRTAKELCRQALTNPVFRGIPVYPDPVSGKYKVAHNWVKDYGYELLVEYEGKKGLEDPEITVTPGDWLIHTMINPNENEYMLSWNQSFRKAGGKIGFILYDLIPEEHPEFYRKRDARLFQRWLKQIAMGDAIFAISKTTMNSYLHWSIKNKIDNKARVEYFYLGANLKDIPNVDHGKTLPQEVIEKPYFLLVSTIEPRKGHRQVLAAFESIWKKNEDLNLVFVGREGWKVSSFCRRLRNHPELGRRFFWFDHASDELLQMLYKNCQAVIVASEAEGFGLSVVEARHYQKTAIIRNIPVFHEIAGDDAIYFSGKEPESIVNAIYEALSSEEKTIPNNFNLSWENSYRSLVNLIKKDEQ